MADSGKAQKAVVRKLVSDLRFYSAQVKIQADKINKIADDMSSSWRDGQYQKFRAYIGGLSSELKNDTKELDYAADMLEKTEINGI